MKRAQIAYEFIMVFLVLGLGFISWIVLASAFQADLQRVKNIEDFTDFTLGLKHDLYVVAQMPDGFSKTLNVPMSINGFDYSISATNISTASFNFSFVQINSTDLGFFTSFDGPYLNDTIKKGDNVLIKKGNQILVKN